MQKKLKNYFIQSYIQPFLAPQYARFCWANLLGMVGCTLIGLAYTFELGSLSQHTSLMFFITEAFLIGLVIMPLGLWFYRKVNLNIWSITVALMTLLPVIALALGIENYTIKAILYSFSTTGFWLLFHIFMTYNASVDNKGNDVSIALNGIAIGCLIGTGIATIMAALAFPVLVSATIGSVFCFISVILLSRCVLKTKFLYKTLNKNQKDTITTVLKRARNFTWHRACLRFNNLHTLIIRNKSLFHNYRNNFNSVILFV